MNGTHSVDDCDVRWFWQALNQLVPREETMKLNAIAAAFVPELGG
jgi:hypothetical protein